ncbi:hypothetical protein T4D_11296 [Trichinella pseudospiralis]|uniref:Uncharacterized protein n=1 Tax=Trichinella pseudospiralis TaxID=6337 RepID=A0A0V1FNF2_TRIPS|nr:hypothetical protein T4D_11296 [Trichinella pseudospiralis]
MVPKYFRQNRKKSFYQQAGMVAKPTYLVKQNSDDGMQFWARQLVVQMEKGQLHVISNAQYGDH